MDDKPAARIHMGRPRYGRSWAGAAGHPKLHSETDPELDTRLHLTPNP